MRLAVVTGGLKLGGSTTFLCNLLGELVRRGVSSEIFSFENENPLASDFAELNIPVTCFDDAHSIFEDRMVSILKQLREFRPTVVLANLSQSSFEVLRYMPKGVLRVGIVQSDDPGAYNALRNYGPFIDAVAGVSKEIESRLKSIPEFQHSPVYYLPYGVPMPESISPRPKSEEMIKVLYLGRLEQEQKRVRLFPEILTELKKSEIPFHWTIAGDGPERGFLEESMVSSTGQTVRFIGKVPYADVPQCLNQHDVFLLASDYEGLPLSLLEAMGRGLVPVVSDLPSGIGEVIDETNGKRIPMADTAGYAKAIVWMYQHPTEMRRMSQAAHEKVRREFSVTAMTDRWMLLFSKAANNPVNWPSRWQIEPILNVNYPIYYSRPVRMLRRVVKKLRSV